MAVPLPAAGGALSACGAPAPGGGPQLSPWTTGVPRPGVRCHPTASGISTDPPKGRGVASQGFQSGEGRATQGSGPQSFWHQGPVLWKIIFPWTVTGGRFEMFQAHYISCALYCCYYYISFTSDHPGVRSWRLGTLG